MKRSTRLRANRDHDPELTGDCGEWGQYTCTRCGDSATRRQANVEAGERVFPWPCSGLSRGSGPERKNGIRSVSPDRPEKRRQRGIYGPLCDFVRGRTCLVPGCEAPSDPAHVKNVGAGHADWLRGAGEPYPNVVWWGNVCRLCRRHHREFDGDIGGGSGHLFADRYDISPRAEARKLGAAFAREHDIDLESDIHPYEQMEAA